VSVGPIFFGPRNSGRAEIRVRNPNGFPVTLETITVLPPASVAANLRPPQGWSAGGDGTLSIGPESVLAAGTSYLTSLTLQAPMSAAVLPFAISTTISLPDGTLITPRTTAKVAVGRNFTVRVTTTTGSRLGTIKVAFPEKRPTLTTAAAKGFLSLRTGRRLWHATFAAATLSQRDGSAALTLSGRWTGSSSCGARTAKLVLNLAAAFAPQPYRGTYSFLPPCAKRFAHAEVNASVVTR